MYKTLSRIMFVVIAVGLVAGPATVQLKAQAGAVSSADAKAWMGDWTLTLQGGRGPQERTLTVKDAAGKGAATLGGGRGGPIEIADVSEGGSDLVLKFKQQGRGGEVDVVMTLAMQPDGTLKATQNAGNNSQTGTGKKKV